MESSITRKNNILPNQRISLKHKQSQKWTKEMADYVINLAVSSNNKNEVRDLLDMANGIVKKEMYEYVLKTYIDVEGNDKSKQDRERLIADLRQINFLQPIKDKYLGEFISSYNNYQVYTDDPDTVFIRNKEFGKDVLAVMEQLLINELNAQNINTGQPSKEMPDIETLLKKHIENWDDKRAEDAQKRLNLLNNEIKAKLKYNQAYYYWWACEQVYTYRGIHKGEVIFEVISPMDYYRVNSGNDFVEDDDYGMRIMHKSLYQILDLYSEYLSQKDIDFLKAYVSKDITSETRIGMLKSRLIEHGMSPEDFLQYSDRFSDQSLSNPDLIPVIHYVAKTEVKIGYLTFINDNQELEQTIVDEDYIFDITKGDVDIKWDWIQQMYHGEVIGYNLSGTYNHQAIYTKFRPVDIQRERFTNLNKCKSPYNGLSYIHKDSTPEPIPLRVNAYLALYRIYHYQIEKAINSWKSILPIPQSLLTDDENMSMDERLSYMSKNSMLIYNDAEVNVNSLQTMREIATTATYNYVTTLIGLLQSIKADAWEVANMTPTRMGSQKAYQGKGVTEASLEQGAISSSWSLEMFNIFRATDYLANYDYSKIAWAEGKEGSYTDESTNELKRVSVNPMEHFSLNIGINVGNSRLLDEKLRAMKEVAFSASQNGEFELATEAIMNDNLQVLRGKIMEVSNATREYKAQMEQAKNMAVENAARMNQETKTMELEVSKEIEYIKSDKELSKALIDQETQLLVWEMRLQSDDDGNGYVSKDESDNINLGIMEKIKLQREALDIKYQELAIKRKQLKQSQNKTNTAK